MLVYELLVDVFCYLQMFIYLCRAEFQVGNLTIQLHIAENLV